jgi:PIN domain nuclease of toxin-antitoxin system
VILLDTHALIWWADGDHQRLSAAALAAIDQEIETAGRPDGSRGLLVSAISCWEVAMLVNRGRLALSFDVEHWLALLSSHPSVRLLALDPAVAVASTRLPEPFHADPADRFLVAQARELGIPLLSADSKIRAYGHVRSHW